MAEAGAPGHHRHDPVLVAAAVGHALAGPDAGLASSWRACPECARLHRDLTRIAVALPMTWTPRRPRDYELGDADARRLRSGGWRGWWARIGTARDTVTRPLAAGLTTLGVAGLLVAAVPGAVGAGATGGAAGPMIEHVAPPTDDVSVTKATGTGPGGNEAPASSAYQPEPAGVPPFVVLSWSFVTAGGGLFVARAVAGRRAMR